MLLSQYRVGVRRLVNDAQSNYWTDPELNDYINEARRKTAVDTLCVRSFQEADLIPGQERYQYTDLLPNGQNTIDIINVTLIWGATRVPMRYHPYTIFSAYFRPWTGYRQLPAAFTTYNATTFWLAPIPDQPYHAEFDTGIIPADLASDNSVDPIPIPYSEAVKYYAARLARLKLQQYTEAEAQVKMYTTRIAELNAMYPRHIPYVFSTEELY